MKSNTGKIINCFYASIGTVVIMSVLIKLLHFVGTFCVRYLDGLGLPIEAESALFSFGATFGALFGFFFGMWVGESSTQLEEV